MRRLQKLQYAGIHLFRSPMRIVTCNLSEAKIWRGVCSSAYISTDDALYFLKYWPTWNNISRIWANYLLYSLQIPQIIERERKTLPQKQECTRRTQERNIMRRTCQFWIVHSEWVSDAEVMFNLSFETKIQNIPDDATRPIQLITPNFLYSSPAKCNPKWGVQLKKRDYVMTREPCPSIRNA